MARTKKDEQSQSDPIAGMMASLLPVHAALTPEWLVDAAATAAERGLNASFSFVFFEDQDGRLDCKAPASDLRRRSLQRVADAFGCDLTRRKLDPNDSPQLFEALDGGTAVGTSPREFFEALAPGRVGEQEADPLALRHAIIAPMETAGERIGALLLLAHDAPNPEHARLLADHIACASVNLRNAHSAREHGVTDAVRSVFDARKLESELQRELSRAERYGREVSIVVIEATNLELLRDQFGGFLTDRLLQRLGESLVQHARDVDLIGAYKESGYTMILTEATPEGAALGAHRLLERARSTRLDESVPGLELHLVAGWATCPTDGVTSDALLTMAELRMYDAASQVA